MSQTSHKGKLRNKILLVMALVGCVPILVAALVTRSVVESSHRADVAKLESAILTETAAAVRNVIDEGLLTQTTVVVVSGPSLQNSVAAQQFGITQAMNTLSFLESESFVSLDGHETAHIDRTHAQGYASSSLRDLHDDPGFKTAREGNYYIGPPSYDTGVPHITFASPVRDSGGQTVGVVVGEASLRAVGNLVAQAKISEAGYLYLVDQNGIVIGGGGGTSPGSSSVGGLDIVKKVLMGDTLTAPETQMRYRGALGADVVAAAMPLSEHGATWGLVAEWPTAEADAVVNALFLKDLLILALALIIVIALSILATLFLTRPLKKLEEGTERVARGKFDEGVYISTGDELQDLGNSFNAMVLGLKQLEQLKDEFVFIAAHELRTPVAAMKGYLTLILEGTTGAITDGTRGYIERVINANQRLIQLVNDLLEVARSQAGRLTIKVAPVAIAPPIASVLDELRSLADEKSVSITYEPPADLPNVLADADRVKEVVVNLIGNAIKYMGGAGKVTVSHERKEGKLITYIADTGLGMSKEAQEKLFQKFYRVQTEKTRDITGTGLGLFIVKEIIEKMNGTIWVISEEGKGSTFAFALPIAQ